MHPLKRGWQALGGKAAVGGDRAENKQGVGAVGNNVPCRQFSAAYYFFQPPKTPLLAPSRFHHLEHHPCPSNRFQPNWRTPRVPKQGFSGGFRRSPSGFPSWPGLCPSTDKTPTRPPILSGNPGASWRMKFNQTQSGGAAGAVQTPIQPAFIRPPRAGQRDPLCGLSRTQLHGLIKSGRVRSVALKQPGCKRGVRLINAASLIAAIEGAACKPGCAGETGIAASPTG